ncbi:hypothetical protein L1049_003545 [Liquidambar formosana]|uniref:Bet v I/Major latex protein domain-containing protein n=1 Tax=Liquidambar formosana TaxID=63359 RepID=A0AAP0N3H4_LIQFO
MAVVTFADEFTSSISAPRLFNALFLQADALLPKLMPQVIKSIETIGCDGGAGSIRQINFAEGYQLKTLKQRIDAMDKEKMIYNYTLIEGDSLMDKIESISNETKFKTSADGGTICKNVSKYYPKAGIEIKEEEIKAGKERAMGMFKAVEAYLLANPDAYA